MTRLFPYPWFSVALAAMWLVLNGSLEFVHLVMGTLVGAAGGLVFARLQAPEGKIRRRAGAVVSLLWLVLLDIVASNIAVLKIVLQPGSGSRRSGFLSMPLQLRHPGGLAVLACIITATPGTSWARYDAAPNVLTIHVLDLVDEEAWIDQFKNRYERRLMEIFQ
jgi:multicomponent K+:H+ antiporter subunit E